jgi:hypothetical protein
VKQFTLVTVLLSAIIAAVFWPALHGNRVMFSSDGPLGSVVATDSQLPASSVGVWQDLNHIGGQDPPLPLSPSSGFRAACFNSGWLGWGVVIVFAYWFSCAVCGDGWRQAARQATASVCLVCAACCCALGVGVACGWIDRLGESAWYNAPLVTTLLFPFLLIVTFELESQPKKVKP